jgi:hypothetical protein
VARSNHAATCAAALGNSVASIARLLGVSRSTIYLEGFYVSQQMLRRLDSRPLTYLFLDNGSTKLSWSDHDNIRWSVVAARAWGVLAGAGSREPGRSVNRG